MQEIYLWPENLRSWQLFMRCETQWDCAGIGGTRYRLNYPGVEVVIARMRIHPRRRDEAFMDVQLMERAVLKVWAERAARK